MPFIANLNPYIILKNQKVQKFSQTIPTCHVFQPLLRPQSLSIFIISVNFPSIVFPFICDKKSTGCNTQEMLTSFQVVLSRSWDNGSGNQNLEDKDLVYLIHLVSSLVPNVGVITWLDWCVEAEGDVDTITNTGPTIKLWKSKSILEQ